MNKLSERETCHDQLEVTQKRLPLAYRDIDLAHPGYLRRLQLSSPEISVRFFSQITSAVLFSTHQPSRCPRP